MGESNPRDPLAGIEEASLLDVPPPPRLIMPSVWLATVGSAESTTGSSRTAGAPVGTEWLHQAQERCQHVRHWQSHCYRLLCKRLIVPAIFLSLLLFFFILCSFKNLL